jgi:hypothetical protein
MTAKSWKKEYYPIDAETFCGKNHTARNILDAAKHSLRKWEGTLPKNRAKHGVKLNKRYSELRDKYGETFMNFGTNTCTLCQIFMEESKGYPNCYMCPLAKDFGSCYRHNSVYHEAVVNSTKLGLMVKALRHVVKNLEKE